MDIDRSRFLLLAGALSTVGCASATTGRTPDAGQSAPSDAAAGPPGPDGGVDGSVCDDDAVGDVAPCAPFLEGLAADAGSGSCFALEPKTVCAYIPQMKPREGAAFLACAMTSPACEGLGACITNALAAACPDPTAATTCTSILAICDAVTASACEDAVAGLSAAGRNTFASCIANSCNVATCVASL